MKNVMSSPNDPTVEPYGASDVRLSIDEATVLLGLLDLLQPGTGADASIGTLVERTRARLVAAISEAISTSRTPNGGGLRSV
jgi:hypothetical protein